MRLALRLRESNQRHTSMIRIHYLFMHAMARIAAPIMRKTGYRFPKEWRGNKLINHVEANILADGVKPDHVRF